MATERQEALPLGEEARVEVEDKGQPRARARLDAARYPPGSIEWYEEKQREYWNAAFPHKRR